MKKEWEKNKVTKKNLWNKFIVWKKKIWKREKKRKINLNEND